MDGGDFESLRVGSFTKGEEGWEGKPTGLVDGPQFGETLFSLRVTTVKYYFTTGEV